MRISLLLLTIGLQVNATTYSQNVKFNLNIKDQPIREVFKEIESKSQFHFFFGDNLVLLDKVVDVNVENSNVEQILDGLLDKSEYSYKVLENKLIVIAPKNFINRQNVKVTGTVTDVSTGEFLPGVSIQIEGTAIGAISDANGRYSIDVPDANAVLLFSFMGYLTEKITVSDKSVIDVKLSPDIKKLDEVVVVGFGSQKRVNLTGSVTTVDLKTLETRPVSNVTQALEGISPGLNIKQGMGGEMGTQPTINIRGITTIGGTSSGSPLVLIDGMEGDINSLNPLDIENISVLKDAASSSIYGSRAPFGVILITTKKGKAGKFSVNYNGSFRFSSPFTLPQMANSYEWATYFNAMEVNSGRNAFFNNEWIERIKSFMNGTLPKNTYNGKEYPMTTLVNPKDPQQWAFGYDAGNDNVDWYKAIYKSSTFSKEHNISVTGGNDNLTYYLSGNFLDNPGLLKIGGDHMWKYNATSNISLKLSKIASIDYNGKFSRYQFEQPQTTRGRNDFWFAEQAWPMLALYDPNGYYIFAPSAALPMAEGGREKHQNDIIYQQFGLTLEPIKNFKIIGKLNFRIENNFQHIDKQKLYNHDVQGNRILIDGDNWVREQVQKVNYTSPYIYAEYSKSFEKHNFKAMAGYQSELYNSRSIDGTKKGIIVPSVTEISATTGADNSGKAVSPSLTGDYQEWATAGYFGRFNYDFDGRYLLEANVRYDGTSRFRSDNRWNLFPSASLGWNIAKESFWSGIIKYVNELKFRASYGKLGNQNTNSYYPTYSSMNIGTANGYWMVNGSQPNTAYQPNLISSSLTWEKVKTYNIGADVGVFRNRLKTSFDYFVRYTNDMVGPAPELPVTLGIAVPQTNNTNLKTYGFELDIAWQDKLSNGMGYNIHFVLADSKTTILDYPNPTKTIGYANDWNGYVKYNTYMSGETYGDIWGFKTKGIAKTQSEMDAHLTSLPNGGQNAIDPGNQGTWGAGDIMYQDLNGDGKISKGAYTYDDHGDLTVIGNITPRYSFGLNLGADWKNFDFSLFVQGILKRDYFNNGYYFWGAGRAIWESTAFKEHLDYFRDKPDGPLGVNLDAYYPRPSEPDNWSGNTMGKNHEVQSKYVQNAAYARLKNLQLGYTLPASISKKINIQKLRIYFSGENLMTYTKLSKIFDPETVDHPNGGNAYPLSKVYTLGLNVTF